jgi:anti-anti-sigma regulatory factor
MLRITVEENTEAMVLKLEGRVAGPWADELSRFWQETAPSLVQKKLLLDLRETTYADASGMQTLQAIYSQTGASILAVTPWTQYLADEITTNNANDSKLEGSNV